MPAGVPNEADDCMATVGAYYFIVFTVDYDDNTRSGISVYRGTNEDGKRVYYWNGENVVPRFVHRVERR